MRPLLPALLAVVGLAVAGVAGAAVDLNAAIEKQVMEADSVRVFRLRDAIDSGTMGSSGYDRLDDFMVERIGEPPVPWKAAMAEALTSAMRRFPSPVICPREQGPRRVRFGVQFFHGSGRTTFIVYLGERCVEFWTGRRFEGSALMQDLAPRFLTLLKQPFRDDPVVQRLDLSGLVSCEDYRREHPLDPYVEQLPEPTRRVPATYPKAAKKAKVEGQVLVQAWVGTDGQVGEVRVIRSVPALDSAAVASARQWRFAPALDCWGQPVPAWVAIPVRFALD